ncbi:beta strand repeat-containing protein [Hymenobacter rubidus]|uniref:beta strand repeat-containing protein n=1 Tax=Hymenobacter rubidus TaxID=1441626 RepID=UPI00191FCA73|nr:GEVED domain-containing protein [Hymenobacter rubidus]
MKIPFTQLLKLLLLVLGVGGAVHAQSYQQVPLAASSFTADVVANGTTASTSPLNSTTSDVDGGGYYFLSQDYNSTAVPHTSGLPTNGTIPNVIAGYSALTYQLASYGTVSGGVNVNSNNVLRIAGTGSGTLAFATPQAATEVYVLATGGGGAPTANLTVNFSDGTSQAFTGISILDWYTGGATAAFGMTARVGTNNAISPTTATGTAPFLYQVKLVLSAANVTKTITGVTIAKTTSANYLNAFAVSILPTCSAAPTNQTAFAATTSGGTTALTMACPTTSIYLSVPPQGAFTYQWQSSPDNATWANISGATSNTYTATQTAATYYRVLEACPYDGSGGTVVASGSVQVGQNTAVNCPCVPNRSSTSTSYATVSSVSLPGDGGVTLSNAPGLITSSSAGYVSNSYAVYPASTTTTTISPSTTYALSVAVPAYTRASAWVDYNQNGTYEASEFYILTTGAAVYSSSATTLTVSIPVPATATPGQTRLRIRTDYYGNTTLNTYTGACSTTTYGQSMDYYLTMATPIACSGTPPATTATATATSVCGSTGFTLNATGVPAGTTGLSYQWQSSPAGANTFANLGSAQAAPSYAVSSISASTDYRLVVTCTASGQSTTSSIVSVARAYLTCYCAVVSTGTGEYIKSVTFPGTPGFTNTTNANSTNGTGDFTGNSALTTTLNQGATYLNGVSITVHSNNTGSQGGMWIDYDHSGTFETTEYIALGGSSLINTDVTLTTTLTVPTTALTGPTRVRVRWRNGTIANTDACTTGTSTWYGETEDYQISIAAPTTCSAPPSSVVATANTTNACANASFMLSTNSIPTILGGYTYQWQSSPAGAGTFTNISGATTQSYTVASQTAATDYQLIVGCQYGGTPVTSNVVSVGQNPFDQCYCTTSSTHGCGTYGSIANVSIGTLNNSSGCAASSYTVYPASTATTNLNANASATLTLTIANASAGYRYGVWIDFNQNGTFDGSEFVASSTTSTTASPTATIAIPASALAGPTRMRVRTKAGITSYGDFASSDACSVQYDGETEDYTVTIVAPTACTGAPAAPVASASASTVCAGTSFTLSAPNPGNITGLSYQWQSSPAGANTFANLSGATASTYTVSSQTAATDYRVVVTCAGSGLSTPSNVVSVGQNSFAACYCTPTGGVCTNEYIRGVIVNTLSNTGTACTTGGYADYTANAALTTTLAAGGTYSVTLNLRINSNPAAAGVWIDYDHSGTFDAGEFTQVYSNTAAASNLDVSGTASITVPAGALTGATRMRVRSANSTVPLSATTACPPNPYYGEIEDYLITISGTIPDLTVSTTTTIPAGTYNNVTVTSTGNATLTGATVVNGAFQVLAGGTLTTACQPLTGPGSFGLAAGATLSICDPAGITLSGATGAIQTATRTFSIAGTYVYSGGASQSTGSALPAQVRNLTVSTTGGAALTLSQPVAIRRLLSLNSGNLLGGQNLTLRSDADSTALVAVAAGGGTVTGAATVQRYISPATNAGLGYRHFAAPVTNTTVADLATGSFSPSVSQGAAYNASATPGTVTPFPTVFSYSEARQATSPATSYSVFDRGWLAATSTGDALTSGKGYTVNLAAGQMVDFVGTLGTGTVAMALTRGATTDAGWNLLGNPYPSTLNWDNVTIPTGMDAAVYVYRSASQYTGSYTSYTNGLGTGGGRTSTIGMGQGFLVRVSPGTTSTTLTLTDAARSTDFGSGGALQRGNDPRARVRLALENISASLSDAAYVYFEAGATTGIDARYDAVKLANPTGLGLAAIAAGTELAINGLPLLSTATVVPLTVTVPQAGTYTLRAEELVNLPAGLVYLRDALTGQQINLLQQASYTFSTAGAAAIAGRFSLGFALAAPLATPAGLSAASVSVFPNPAHTGVTVLVPAVDGARQVQLTLLNSLGQRVSEKTVPLGTAGAQATLDVSGLAAGIYTLRLQVAGQAAVARRVAVE